MLGKGAIWTLMLVIFPKKKFKIQYNRRLKQKMEVDH